MQSLLLVVASELELQYFRNLIFPSGIKVDFLISGIGLLSSGFRITEKLLKNNYDLVLQLGLAGSFDIEKLPLGTVVLVGRDCDVQLGVWQEDDFWDIFRLGLQEYNFPFIKNYLQNPYVSQIKSLLPVVNGVSVSTISTEPKHIQYYSQFHQAEIESMEGASLHYICLMRGLRFFQIRGISNRVGERDKKNWRIEEPLIKISKFLAEYILEFF